MCRAAVPDPGQFVGTVLGDPPAQGSLRVTNGVVQLSAQGAGLGGRSDSGYFAYAGFGTNDFDVKVRVRSLDPTALSARAGLMVRDDTAATAVMAAVVVTPGLNGVQFLARTSAEFTATASGSFPANLPNAWLRLQRSGDFVRGYASLDGRRWTQIGRAALTLTNVLAGFSVSSARTNAPANAEFTDWAEGTGDSDDPAPPPFEPPGPSSRRTALVISEIHYNPPLRQGAGEGPHQFIEVFNSDFTAKELGGHRLEANGLSYVFPTNTVLPAGGYLVVAQDPDALRKLHPRLPADQTLGPWEGGLDRDSDTVRLWSPFGALLLEVPYTDQAPWPLAADGEGHTLVLARPSWGEADPRAWSASAEMAGSPGRADVAESDPRGGLRITEVLGQRDGAIAPYVEVFNTGLDPAPLGEVVVAGPLADARPEIRLPSRTLAPGERVVVEVPAAGVPLPSPLLLRAPAAGRVWDVVSFGGTATNVALGRGRWDDPELRRLTSPTPGQANAAARRPRVVISEVMYRPLSGRDDDQYLELWNPGAAAVDLTGWRLTDGATFEFPARRSLGAGERLVLARNAARLQLTYTNLPPSRILGEFSGRLGSRGERLTLRDETGAVEFGFTYRTGGEWPTLPDGGGSSLELLHPDLDPELGSSWAASDESARAPWQTYEVSGLLEGGTGSINDVRVILLGAGETLVDDVEVAADGGANLLANPNFEGGILGWTVGGTHDQSGLSTNGGFGGSAQALRVRAAGRGDNGINSVRAVLRNGLRAGTNATLRLRARWLAGTRNLLFRVKGNYLELPIRLDVPADLGTPGLPNTHALAEARPALADLAHFPVLPPEGQPVRVTVRVAGDPGALRPVLHYRLDPATDFAAPLVMNDAGSDGDRVAGDGVYTAVIPGQVARAMAAFHVTLGAEGAEFRVPRTTPGREALVRWGEPQLAGNLGTYRIWITRATETRWTSRPKLHNGDLDATFVYGATRAVYGLGALYSGSPFVSPGYNGPAGSTLCGYVLHFPDDDAFLGETDFVMDWPIRDDTRQLEQRAYEFAAEIGLPYLHRRFIHFYVNSAKRGAVYEDTQQPGSAYLRNWSPGDDDGSLHKIEDWFEFGSTGEMEINNDARLDDFRRSDGSRNVARYRWNFRPRSVQDSAHDFSDLFRLVDAATAPTFVLEYQRELEREMDVDEWAGVFALEHAVGNWDSFGYSRGKNMFAYRPQRGPWRLYMWDIDFVMSASGEGPNNWPYSTIDSTISTLYQYPPFQRAYWRAMKKLVNGPMVAERFAARADAVRQGLLENGVNAIVPTTAKNWVRDQRAALQGQLDAFDNNFTLEHSLVNGATSDPVVTLQGQGPLEMTGLSVNGEIRPIRWIQMDRWFLELTLPAGRTPLTIVPVDATGRRLASVRTINATLTKPPEPEDQRVVFNEIHFAPRVPGGAFVELFNPSFDQSIDLSGLQLTGGGLYEFPANSFLLPNQFLTVGRSFSAFQAEFGRSQFPGALMAWSPSPEGETLALVRPARGTNPAVTLTAVTYRPDGPWPSVTSGHSLQLRDPSRGEDDRVGDWTVYTPPTNASPWKEFAVTGTASGTNLVLYVSSFPPSLAPNDIAGRWIGSLTSFGFSFALEITRSAAGVLSGQLLGDLSVDPELVGTGLSGISVDASGAVRFTWTDLNGRFVGRLDATGRRATGTFTYDGGTSPFTLTRQTPPGTVILDDLRLTREGDAAATNLLRNGDFQAGLGTEWLAGEGYQDSARVDLSVPGSTGPADFALRLVGTQGGDGSVSNAFSQPISGVVTGATYRLTGRYQSVQAQGLVVALEGGPRYTADLRPRSGTLSEATPGRRNSVAATIEPIPTVWVNEVQPENVDGPRDASGRTEPWLEVHNSGPTPAALEGYFLSDDPLVPDKWALPAGVVVPAGGFLLVWLDGQVAESTPAAPHARFRPSPGDGTVVLTRAMEDGSRLTVDFLHYADVPPGRSFGHLPETWVHADGVLPQPTPGLPNGTTAAPERISINEWMATNDGSTRDPADQDADDWFELFNPGPSEVNLEGWLLSDTSANPAKFRIPAGYRIAASGFLVVWADEESGQNQSDRPDLHVNFRLSGGGEEILLSRPDGSPMDHVVFGSQSAGFSEGRATDGAAGTNFVRFANATPGRSNRAAPAPNPDIVAVDHRADGVLAIRFVAEPGARYRLRTKEDLQQATWTPTTATVTATGATGELPWRIDDAPQRFLQVERVP